MCLFAVLIYLLIHPSSKGIGHLLPDKAYTGKCRDAKINKIHIKINIRFIFKKINNSLHSKGSQIVELMLSCILIGLCSLKNIFKYIITFKCLYNNLMNQVDVISPVLQMDKLHHLSGSLASQLITMTGGSIGMQQKSPEKIKK